MDEPSAVLRHEHQVILHVVNGLDRLAGQIRRGQDVEIGKLRFAIRFMREFADRCHHAKEESILFPGLIDKGVGDAHGPIAQLLFEHRLARNYVTKLEDAIDRYNEDRGAAAAGRISACIRDIVELYTSHIAKEDMVLLPMADRLFSSEERAALSKEFDDVERALGMDHEVLETLAKSFMGTRVHHEHHVHA